ncbi:biotin-dependent carboxyltransferase family protein [Saccharibacillus sp. O23]|uniref:5-oxoprolinase subunit C family protein n=1 Tax=Saccharibacillus sp. O23 TaxID=2009338 RepID=UPI00359314B9
MTASTQPGTTETRFDTQIAEPRDADEAAPVITVLKPGLLTTLQDLGRPGFQQYGVTPGGAMDAYALRAANLMVGNGESEAALEITLAGPTLRFERETLIALTGADLAPSIGGEALPMWRPVRIRAGAVLEFRTAVTGCRAYLAAAGGFGAPEAMGSRSTDLRAGLGGLEGRALRAGDVLHARTSAVASGAFGPLRAIAPGADFAAAAVHAAHGYLVGRPDWADVPAGGFASPGAAAYSGGGRDSAAESGRFPQQDTDPAVSGFASSTDGFRRRRSAVPTAKPGLPPSSFAPPVSLTSPVAPPSPAPTTIRFTRGTHFHLFDETSRAALSNAVFRVDPQSDRMGCRLTGPALRLSRPLEMISEAAAFGTVQVPPGGDPIALAADRQTTGGYPRIAQIAAVDLRILGQLRPGQTIRFVEITLAEAERLHIERERELARLRVAWRLWRKG